MLPILLYGSHFTSNITILCLHINDNYVPLSHIRL